MKELCIACQENPVDPAFKYPVCTQCGIILMKRRREQLDREFGIKKEE